jgi:hypothetical protein
VKRSAARGIGTKRYANIDDLNGHISCDAATLARAISSHR